MSRVIHGCARVVVVEACESKPFTLALELTYIEESAFSKEVPARKTLMNFSHLWTTHGFSLLLNCLFEYSHLNTETSDS